MTGKVIRMSQLKQILRLHQEGMSNRQIAKNLGIYKETVNKYLKKVQKGSSDIGKLLQVEDPVLEGREYGLPGAAFPGAQSNAPISGKRA